MRHFKTRSLVQWCHAAMIIALMILLAVVMACSDDPDVEPTPAATPSSPVASPTTSPAPTATPTLTQSPAPTATPTLTQSPVPTATPTGTPTPTPEPTATPAQPASDWDVLVALYHSTGGASWDANTNWLSDKPIGEWYGVTTNSNGRVIALKLFDNQLTGEIPTELAGLSNLETLWLASNQLTGEIPPELGGLSNLTGLYLNGNQLTGEIPPELAGLSNLERLYLNGNQLTGKIPPELGPLSKLWVLYLNDNQLTGCIPGGLRDYVVNDLSELNLPDCKASSPTPTPAHTLITSRTYTPQRNLSDPHYGYWKWPRLPPLPPGTGGQREVSFDAIQPHRDIRAPTPEREQLIRELPWVRDGLLVSEMEAGRGLMLLATSAGDVFDSLISQPWVVDGIYKPTMYSLGQLAGDSDALTRIMSHPAISDGITEVEAAILATMWEVSPGYPELESRLLDRRQVNIEKGTVVLPLSGETQIVVIDTVVKDTYSTAWPYWKDVASALLSIESFMSVPLPQSPVIILIVQDVRGGPIGSFIGNHVIIEYDSFADSIDHELAHYYWHSGRLWINEGAAELLQAELLEEGDRQAFQFCKFPGNFSQFERGEGDAHTLEVHCAYKMGYQFFYELQRTLGERAFREGFRNLHLMTYSPANPDFDCEGILGECHVEAAFTANVSAEEAQRASEFINFWYNGTDPQGYTDVRRLQGTIVGPDGEPVEGCNVFFAYDSFWFDSISSTTGSDGQYETIWHKDVAATALIQIRNCFGVDNVGYYGPDGFTRYPKLATRIDVSQAVTRIDIRIPEIPTRNAPWP